MTLYLTPTDSFDLPHLDCLLQLTMGLDLRRTDFSSPEQYLREADTHTGRVGQTLATVRGHIRNVWIQSHAHRVPFPSSGFGPAFFRYLPRRFGALLLADLEGIAPNAVRELLAEGDRTGGGGVPSRLFCVSCPRAEAEAVALGEEFEKRGVFFRSCDW